MKPFQELVEEELERIHRIQSVANSGTFESILATLLLMRGLDFAKFQIEGIQHLVAMAKNKLNEKLPTHIRVLEEGLVHMSLSLAMHGEKMGAIDLVNTTISLDCVTSEITMLDKRIIEIQARISKLKPERLDRMLHGKEEEKVNKEIEERKKELKQKEEKRKLLKDNKSFIEKNTDMFEPFELK